MRPKTLLLVVCCDVTRRGGLSPPSSSCCCCRLFALICLSKSTWCIDRYMPGGGVLSRTTSGSPVKTQRGQLSALKRRAEWGWLQVRRRGQRETGTKWARRLRQLCGFFLFLDELRVMVFGRKGSAHLPHLPRATSATPTQDHRRVRTKTVLKGCHAGHTGCQQPTRPNPPHQKKKKSGEHHPVHRSQVGVNVGNLGSCITQARGDRGSSQPATGRRVDSIATRLPHRPVDRK